MQLFLHIVFWLKEISEAPAEEPKNTFRVSIHHKGCFSLSFVNLLLLLEYFGKREKRAADVPNFLRSFTIIQGGASSVDSVLFCLHIHKFFSFVRVAE